MYIHPLWNGKYHDGFDMALLLLPKPVKKAPVMLPDKNYPVLPNTPVYALGWGRYFELNSEGEWIERQKDELQSINLNIVGIENCPDHLKQYLKRHMICAFDRLQCPCKGEWIL